MGFIKAIKDSLTGDFADQWLDYLTPDKSVPETAVIFPAVKSATNNGRGENTKGNENVISNGSKILVPEGTALITIQDGAITGCIAEPGPYTFSTDEQNSQSLFAGDGLVGSLIKSTWDKVKFGGIPATQQLAFYVNLKEIPNLKFGTPGPIYWDDAFLQTQVGASLRGTYTMKVTNPLLFIKGYVPVTYLQPNSKPYDLADMDNDSATQLFNEVVSSLNSALSIYSNSGEGGNRISRLQSDQIGVARAMTQAVEENYKWTSDRGLEIVKTAILQLDYTEDSKELLKTANADDVELRKEARRGQLYSQNMSGMMAAATGQAMVNASQNEGGAMMGFMGMNMAQQNGANMMNAVANMQPAQPVQQPMQQPVQPTEPVNQVPVTPEAPVENEMPAASADAPSESTDAPVVPAETQVSTDENPYTKLAELKKLLDAGVISQADFDAAKAKVLGI